MNENLNIEVSADHFQILFGDAREAPLLDTSTLWDAVGQVVTLPRHAELVGLGTVRSSGKIRLAVDFSDNQMDEPPGWQRMGSFNLAVPSGKIVFWSPETEDIDQCTTISVQAGNYHGLAFSRNTNEVVDEMNPIGPDEYKILLWLATSSGTKGSGSFS